MRFLIPVLVAVLAACASEPQPPAAPPFELLIAPETPVPGQDVTLTLENLYGPTVGYNLCTSTLVRDEGGQFVEVPSDRVCTMEIRSLPVGQRDSYTLPMPAGLPTGVYRFRVALDQGEGAGPTTVDSHLFFVNETTAPDTVNP